MLAESPLPRDALPYTSEFGKIKKKLSQKAGRPFTDAEAWQLVSKIGKYGGAAIKGERKRAPRTPTLTEDQQLEILRLLPDGTGRRDDLPYTEKFDDLHRRFNKLTRSQLTQHEFWRGLSRVAKLSRKPKPVFDSAPSGILPTEFVQTLERINPWWRGQPLPPTERYKRWVYHDILERMKSGIAPVIALRGPRQVGKTTIQFQVIEHLLLIARIDSRRILRVQFDDIPGLGKLKNPVEAIVRWYEENVLGESVNAASKRGEHIYILFDELQNISKWSDQLKSIVDHTSARFFVTGSSALRIRKGGDSLAGRINMLELGPLRLGEIAGIRSLGDLQPFANHTLFEDWRKKDFWLELVSYGRKRRRLREKTFALFSEFGGYPRCHTTKGIELGDLRQQMVNAVVRKTIEHDASARAKASLDSRTLHEVFRLMCRYAGQAVRPRRIAEELQAIISGGIKVAAVEEAITFLNDSLLVHLVQPLEMLQKKNNNPAKICICDHFIRNGVLQESIPISPEILQGTNEAICSQAGHVAESVIGYYLRSIPGVDVAWFPERRNESEVDFVVSVGMQRIPIEIKYRRNLSDKSDCAGVHAFLEKPHYQAPFGIVVTQIREGNLSDNVIAVPASTFLLLK